jgi:hypothetical protein
MVRICDGITASRKGCLKLWYHIFVLCGLEELPIIKTAPQVIRLPGSHSHNRGGNNGRFAIGKIVIGSRLKSLKILRAEGIVLRLLALMQCEGMVNRALMA